MRQRRRGIAIVPRLVLSAGFASVVPACVAACGGPDPLLGSGPPDVIGGDVAMAFDRSFFGGDVAMAFDHTSFGGDGVASDAFGPPSDGGSDGADAASPDASDDASDDVSQTD